MLERAKGIEPSYAAWEAAVLPLNYARLVILLNQALLALFNPVFPLVHVANRVAPFRAPGSPLIARAHAVRQANRTAFPCVYGVNDCRARSHYFLRWGSLRVLFRGNIAERLDLA